MTALAIVSIWAGFAAGAADLAGRVVLQTYDLQTDPDSVALLLDLETVEPITTLDIDFVWDDEGAPQFRTAGAGGAPPGRYQPLTCSESEGFNARAAAGEVLDVEIVPAAQSATLVISLYPTSFAERPFGFIGCVADARRPGRPVLAVKGVFATRLEALADGWRLRLTPAPVTLGADDLAAPADEPEDAPTAE